MTPHYYFFVEFHDYATENARVHAIATPLGMDVMYGDIHRWVFLGVNHNSNCPTSIHKYQYCLKNRHIKLNQTYIHFFLDKDIKIVYN